MGSSTMKTQIISLSLLLAAPAFVSTLFAAESVSDPVGAYVINCAEASDTVVAVPFRNSADYVAAVTTVENFVSGTSVDLTFSPSPAWTANQFQNTYYVRFTSGALSGRYYTVTANDADTLTLGLNGDTTTPANADGIMVVKYYTLNELFPQATQTTFVQSLNTLPAGRRSELLVPDNAGLGTNLAPAGSYYIISTGWRKVGSGNTDVGTTPLLPDSYIIVRNKATYGSTSFTSTGAVEMGNIVVPLSTQNGAKQDNFVALTRPVGIQVQDLGLDSTVFTESLNTLPAGRRDELLVYDNAAAVLNKSPSGSYYKIAAGWRKVGSGNTDVGTDVVAPGAGFIIRKYNSDGSTKFWANAPTY